MGIFDQNKISIKESFTNKYKLIISSDFMIGNMPILTTTEIRWEIKVKDITKDKIRIEILTLSNQLINSNNPLVTSASDTSQVFSKMYNELDLIITQNCQILKILNLDLIKEKWSWLKKDLEAIKKQDPMIAHVITLNDEQFKDSNTILKAIQNNEIFTILFHHIFGKGYHSVSDLIEKRNLFNTAFVKWKFRIDRQENTNGDSDIIKVNGFLETPLNKQWIKEFYKDFSHLDLDNIKPIMEESGTYKLDKKTGMVMEAELTKQEIIHPKILYATIKYNLSKDNPVEENKRDISPSEVAISDDQKNKNEPFHSFLLDD